jgi:hypothetical protein
MNTVKSDSLSAFLINIGGALALGSALVLWGGLFGLELPGAFSFGPIRIQDIVCILGIGMIFMGIFIKGKVPIKTVVYFLLFLSWIAYGVIIGYLNRNSVDNIGFETRAQIYALFGAIVGATLPNVKNHAYIANCALIMASAIIIQWVFMLLGVNFLLVSGGNPGNIFTLNIPLVRPPGGFHLVGLGLMLAIGPWSPGIFLSLAILAVAVIISQSKTYWLLAVFALLIGPLAQKRLQAFGFVRNIVLALLVVIVAVFVFNIAGSITNTNISPIEKFTKIFEDSDIRYGVLDVRQLELNYAISAIQQSDPLKILFGHGLGYSYQPLNSIFYRSDITDQKALSMFVHNYPMWVMLKYGLAGLLFLFILLVSIYQGIRKGNIFQKRFGVVFGLLFIGSLAMGTFESPPTAFLFGLLATMVGILKYKSEGVL